MSMLYPYHVALFSLSTMGAFLVALIFWRRRNVPGGLAIFLLMIVATGWAGTSALEYASPDPIRKIFWSEMSYLFIPYAGPLWFLFIMRYFQRDRWITPVWNVLIWVIPTGVMLIALTNRFHGFLWPSVVPVSTNPESRLIYSHGLVSWVIALYSYALILFGTMQLFGSLFRAQTVYRGQAAALIGSLFLPWFGNVAYMFDLLPLPGIDPTPLGFTAGGAVLAFSVFRYRFLDLVPIARHMLFENMRNGVVVLDSEDRILDFNPAARMFLGLDSSFIGKPARTAEILFSAIPAPSGKNAGVPSETDVEVSGAGRTLQISISPFRHHGQAAGRVILVQDITEQRRLERERKEIGDSLEKALSDIQALQHLIPICSYCKKIRTDEGFWLQIESFLAEHSDLVFSHGICPDCMKKHYSWLESPEQAKKKGRN